MTVYHWHHIIPKHAGGTDDPSNLIKLSVEDHAAAHKGLYEKYGRWQDRIAWHFLSNQITSAEAIKQAQREGNMGPRSGRRLEATLENAKKGNMIWTGQKHREETKKQISEKNKEYWGNIKERPWQRFSKFLIDNKEYNGFESVTKEFGISRQTVYNRCNSDKWPNWIRCE